MSNDTAPTIRSLKLTPGALAEWLKKQPEDREFAMGSPSACVLHEYLAETSPVGVDPDLVRITYEEIYTDDDATHRVDITGTWLEQLQRNLVHDDDDTIPADVLNELESLRTDGWITDEDERE
jgi:hypothetical protein